MNARTLTIQILAGVALLGIGFGIGRGGRDREAEVPVASATMRHVLPAGASAVREQAASGEIREFVPVRPFAKGEAEAWLLGLRTKGYAGGLRIFATLDAEAAKEVMSEINAITKSSRDGYGDTAELWKDHADGQLLQSGWVITLGILAAQDPESAVAAINDLGEGNWGHAEMVCAEIARHAPGRLEALLATVIPKLLPAAVQSSVRVLLESDVEAGIALMMKYPGEEFDGTRIELVGSLMESDPQRALALASTLAGEGHDTRPLYNAIDHWLEEDEVAARQWVEEHEGPGRDHARARLLRHDVHRDPEAAVAQFTALRQEGVPDEVLRYAVLPIAQALGVANPGSARTWIDTLPVGSLRDLAVIGLARVWSEQDPSAASEWIATLPQGAERDNGAGFLVEAIRTSDPAAALEWARNVTDEGKRREMIAEVLEEWSEQNPEAAEAAAIGLPEEDRPLEIAEPVDF